MGGSPNRPTSFELHIRPMFRTIDVQHMRFKFDLGSHDAVRENSQVILDRLRDTGRGMMPPRGNGGPWPNEWIALFARWIEENHPA